MKVYVVLKDDGNVCCPSQDIVKIFSTLEAAEAYVAPINKAAYTPPYKGEMHDVEVWDVDSKN